MADPMDELIEQLLEKVALSTSKGFTALEFEDAVKEFYDGKNATSEGDKVVVDEKLIETAFERLCENEDVEIQDLDEENQTPEDQQDTHPTDLQSKLAGKRIITTEDRLWQTVAGHGADSIRIPGMEFELLVTIAQHGPQGILQPAAVKLTGQDKRSVPGRTDSLEKKGYITKNVVTAHATRTSLLRLAKWAQSGGSPHQSLADTFHYEAMFDDTIKLLKENGGISSIDDLCDALGTQAKLKRKLLLKSCMRLSEVGCTRLLTCRVVDEDGNSVMQRSKPGVAKTTRAIQLLREPTAEDKALWVNYRSRARGADGRSVKAVSDEESSGGFASDDAPDEDGMNIDSPASASRSRRETSYDLPPPDTNLTPSRRSTRTRRKSSLAKAADYSRLFEADEEDSDEDAEFEVTESASPEALRKPPQQNGTETPPPATPHPTEKATKPKKARVSLNKDGSVPRKRGRPRKSDATQEDDVPLLDEPPADNSIGFFTFETTPRENTASAFGKMTRMPNPGARTSSRAQNAAGAISSGVESSEAPASSGPVNAEAPASSQLENAKVPSSSRTDNAETPASGKRVRKKSAKALEADALRAAGEPLLSEPVEGYEMNFHDEDDASDAETDSEEPAMEVDSDDNDDAEQDATKAGATPTVVSKTKRAPKKKRDTPVVKKREIPQEEYEEYEKYAQAAAERQVRLEMKAGEKRTASMAELDDAAESLYKVPRTEEQEDADEDSVNLPPDRVAELKAEILAREKPGVYINPPGARNLKLENYVQRGRPRNALIAVVRTDRLNEKTWFQDSDGPRFAPKASRRRTRKIGHGIFFSSLASGISVDGSGSEGEGGDGGRAKKRRKLGDAEQTPSAMQDLGGDGAGDVVEEDDESPRLRRTSRNVRRLSYGFNTAPISPSAEEDDEEHQQSTLTAPTDSPSISTLDGINAAKLELATLQRKRGRPSKKNILRIAVLQRRILAEAAAEKAAIQKDPAEKAPAEKAPAEKAPAEKTPAEKTADEETADEQAADEKTADEEAADEEGAADKSRNTTPVPEEYRQEAAAVPTDETSPPAESIMAPVPASTTASAKFPFERRDEGDQVEPVVDDMEAATLTVEDNSAVEPITDGMEINTAVVEGASAIEPEVAVVAPRQLPVEGAQPEVATTTAPLQPPTMEAVETANYTAIASPQPRPVEAAEPGMNVPEQPPAPAGPPSHTVMTPRAELEALLAIRPAKRTPEIQARIETLRAQLEYAYINGPGTLAELRDLQSRKGRKPATMVARMEVLHKQFPDAGKRRRDWHKFTGKVDAKNVVQEQAGSSAVVPNGLRAVGQQTDFPVPGPNGASTAMHDGVSKTGEQMASAAQAEAPPIIDPALMAGLPISALSGKDDGKLQTAQHATTSDIQTPRPSHGVVDPPATSTHVNGAEMNREAQSEPAVEAAPIESGASAAVLEPAANANVTTISGTDPNGRYSSEYVASHPDETFFHRGAGSWQPGLPPPGKFAKTSVRGPGALEWKQSIAATPTKTPAKATPATATPAKATPAKATRAMSTRARTTPVKETPVSAQAPPPTSNSAATAAPVAPSVSTPLSSLLTIYRPYSSPAIQEVAHPPEASTAERQDDDTAQDVLESQQPDPMVEEDVEMTDAVLTQNGIERDATLPPHEDEDAVMEEDVAGDDHYFPSNNLEGAAGDEQDNSTDELEEDGLAAYNYGYALDSRGTHFPVDLTAAVVVRRPVEQTKSPQKSREQKNAEARSAKIRASQLNKNRQAAKRRRGPARGSKISREMRLQEQNAWPYGLSSSSNMLNQASTLLMGPVQSFHTATGTFATNMGVLPDVPENQDTPRRGLRNRGTLAKLHQDLDDDFCETPGLIVKLKVNNLASVLPPDTAFESGLFSTSAATDAVPISRVTGKPTRAYKRRGKKVTFDIDGSGSDEFQDDGAHEDSEEDFDMSDDDESGVARPERRRRSVGVDGELRLRDMASAAAFKDADRLVIAFALVSAICGGLRVEGISWTLIAHALGFRYDGSFLRRRWDHLKRTRKVDVDRLREAIHEPFLAAYENDEFPRVDFQNLSNTDWPALFNWVQETVVPNLKAEPTTVEGPKVPDLLQSRRETEEHFAIKEPSSLYDVRLDEYFVTITEQSRRNLITKYTYGNALPGELRPKDQVEQDMTLLRSWIRAVAVTKQYNYYPEIAADKLRKFSPAMLQQVTTEMIENHTFSQEKKNRMLPGRNYYISNECLQNFRRWPARPDEARFLRFVAQAWKNINTHFQSYEKLSLVPSASDPEYLVLTNMVAQGLIRMDTVLPEVKEDYDAPFPKLSPWGYCGPTYETKKVDMSRLKFPIVYTKTAAYKSDHELLNDVPIPLYPPHVAGEVGVRIPFWVDIHGNLIDDVWDMVLRSILHILVFRAGSTASMIEQAHGRKLWAWEIELALGWMGEVGIAERVGEGAWKDGVWKGGWRAGDWWYCAFSPEVARWQAPVVLELL